MPVNTGLGLVGVAIQPDAKTPAEEPAFVHGLTSGGSPFAFERTVGTLAVACGYRGNISAHVEEINMNPTVSSLGYQEVLPIYAYGALGKIETRPGPREGLFEHVITVGETLPSLTIFGQEGQEAALGFGKTVSCKVNELELTFSDTEPLTMSPNLMGCNLIRLDENPCLGVPPICYEGFFTPVGGEFKIDTAGRNPQTQVIQAATWTITNDCEPVRDPTTRRPASIAEKISKAAVSFDVVPEDFLEFWKMVTGSVRGTEPANRIVFGSYKATFMHSENPDYTLTIEGSRVPFACEVPEIEPEGGTGVFTFSSEDSYVEKVGDSGIVITVVNDIEDYFDPATYALPDAVPYVIDYGEVLPGVDADELGDFSISARSKVLSGTANRIHGVEGVDDGYYATLSLDEWEGATASTRARGASVPFEDGIAVVYLGYDGIDVESVTVTDGAGEATTYRVAVDCAEDLPAVQVTAASGTHYGIDVSKLGTVSVSNRSRTITGTSEKTAVPDFDGKGKPRDGHFASFDLDPREGTEVRLRKGTEWGDWKASDSEPWVVMLDAGPVPVDAIQVKAPGHEAETYELAIDMVDEEVPVAVSVDRADDTPYEGHTVSDLGSWKVDAATRTITGTSNLISEWSGYTHAERLPAYFAVLDLSPWEGTSARVHRDGEWGGWADCQNNGVVVAFLGTNRICADALEVRAASGEATSYALDIREAASPVRSRRPVKVARADGTASE